MKFQYLYWTPRINQRIWNFVEASEMDGMVEGMIRMSIQYGPMALSEHDWH